MTKQEQESIEIPEAYDLTMSAWSAAELADCDPKTVQRYVQLRDAGKDVFARAVRPKMVDQFVDKIEELVEHSHGNVRADVVHEGLVAMGFGGNERTTGRAVERAKTAYR